MCVFVCLFFIEWSAAAQPTRTDLGPVTSQVVVCSEGELDVLAAVRGGERDADDAAHVARRQPSLLVVVGPVQFPSFVLINAQQIL